MSDVIFLMGIPTLIAFLLAVATVADQKGRSALRWFFLSLLITPLLSLVLLVCLDDLRKAREAAQRIPCPYCAERILRQAQICPFCHSQVSQEGPSWARLD